MKKLIIIFITGFILSSNTYAQELNTSSPTTEEEYNYVTKGYKVQIESGLDMKKGYAFEELFEETNGDYNFTVSCLIREPKKEIAAILVKTKSSISGKVYYFCIPHGNEELNEKYYQDLTGWDYGITKAYNYVMSTKLSEFIALANEMEKRIKK